MSLGSWPAAVLTMVLMAAALAGCLGTDPAPDATGSGTTTPPGDNQTAPGGNGSAPGDGGGAPAEPPVVHVVLSLEGQGLEANGSAYEVPAGVNVTFDASNSTDPAGGELAFAWDFGAATTLDGAAVQFAFDAGNWTVSVTATSSASNLTGTATVDVVSLEVQGIPEPYHFTGALTGVTDAQQECADHEFEVFGPVARLDVAIAYTSDTSIDFDYWLYDPEGTERGEGFTFDEPTGLVYATPENPMSVEDPEPGLWKVTVCAFLAYEGTYDLDVTFA